jgi:hypothetical protein
MTTRQLADVLTARLSIQSSYTIPEDVFTSTNLESYTVTVSLSNNGGPGYELNFEFKGTPTIGNIVYNRGFSDVHRVISEIMMYLDVVHYRRLENGQVARVPELNTTDAEVSRLAKSVFRPMAEPQANTSFEDFLDSQIQNSEQPYEIPGFVFRGTNLEKYQILVGERKKDGVPEYFVYGVFTDPRQTNGLRTIGRKGLSSIKDVRSVISKYLNKDVIIGYDGSIIQVDEDGERIVNGARSYFGIN